MEGERRGGQRFTVPLEVRWERLSGQHGARVSDLSLGGCYIESLVQVTLGEEIRFEIRLPTGFWMPLRGTILYQHPNLGFGVRFAPLTLIEQNVLGRALKATGGGGAL